MTDIVKNWILKANNNFKTGEKEIGRRWIPIAAKSVSSFGNSK